MKFQEFEPSGICEIGNEIRAVVKYKSRDTIIKLNKKQLAFIHDYFRTGDFKGSAANVGVEASTASNWFRDPKFKAFVQSKLEEFQKVTGFGIVDWLSKMIDGFKGETELTETQQYCADRLAKCFGFIKDRTVHEHNSVSEIVFVQGNQSQLDLTRGSDSIRSLPEPIHIPNGGAEIRKNDVDIVEVTEKMPEAEINSVVRGSITEASQRNSLAGSTGITAP